VSEVMKALAFNSLTPTPLPYGNLSARVSGCQKYKWRLNPVWHRMLYIAVPIWQRRTSKG